MRRGAVLGSQASRRRFLAHAGRWEQTVEQRFHDHPELTAAQERMPAHVRGSRAEAVERARQAVALPGIYRMMLSVPRYDLMVCSKPKEMRSIGDQAIAGFLLKLTELLPSWRSRSTRPRPIADLRKRLSRCR